ncbi:sensor histidine kinase [Streptomyces radicis]|uniref:histidine kinase n=2 Tax=Streptomyces radicis TaxID=1750517 RepID=A0A3A9VWI6_9ACTN|nr:sensor histidine kinase [Streptomyces radicis]RKN16446.1 sensor histidine kinase [Streptomyces radicis]
MRPPVLRRSAAARQLSEAARRMAEEFTEYGRRLLAHDGADPADFVPRPIDLQGQDDIGRAGEAIEEVRREAVRVAGEQAVLRRATTQLSRRTLGVVQRQLALISELEERETDQDRLASLFGLDHLAVRVRRLAESALALNGVETYHRWTHPIPLVNVLRAAAYEVADHRRVELSGVPPLDVVEPVVSDLVHLLAELLENATSFSSPQTRVALSGQQLPDGRVLVEIEDRGIGLSRFDMEDINQRLAEPPEVDLAVSHRMGLFLVGRLARRHGIRVQVRPSGSGGTTALVMVPAHAVERGRAHAASGGLATDVG